MNRTLLIGLAGALFAGCVSVGNANLGNEDTIKQIKVGQTTKDQVASLLGEPDERRFTTLSGATYEWWSYSYSSSIINPLEYLLLVGVFFNGFGTPDMRRVLGISFTPEGTVRSVVQQTTTYEMGGLLSTMQVKSHVVVETLTAQMSGQLVRSEDMMEASSITR